MIQMARKKLSPQTICELAYGLLEPNILVLYVSQKKNGKEKNEEKLYSDKLHIFPKQRVIECINEHRSNRVDMVPPVRK